MRWWHPIFDELDGALADLVPRESVTLEGEWTRSTRRTYESEGQAGTGRGPFVEVVDLSWKGALASATPIAVVSFLTTSTGLYWTKSAPATLAQPVNLSLHAYSEYSPERATFSPNVGAAGLPGVVIRCRDHLARTCAISDVAPTTGRVSVLATTDDAAVLVLVVQAGLLKVGRNRLWRLRDELAPSLPSRSRSLLTRRRSGSILEEPAERRTSTRRAVRSFERLTWPGTGRASR